MFARVTLEAVRLVERLNLPLGLVGSRTVHIALFLQRPYLTTTAEELQKALIAYEKKHQSEQHNGHHIFEPFVGL